MPCSTEIKPVKKNHQNDMRHRTKLEPQESRITDRFVNVKLVNDHLVCFCLF